MKKQDGEGDEVLEFLRDGSFNVSEISSNSMRALFHKINTDSAAEPEFELIFGKKGMDGRKWNFIIAI